MTSVANGCRVLVGILFDLGDLYLAPAVERLIEVIHAFALMALARWSPFFDLRQSSCTRYGDVKSHRGDIIEFLGMNMDMSTPGSVSITMKGMESSIVEDAPTERKEYT